YNGDAGVVVYAGGGANELMTGTRKWNSGMVARGSIYIANDNQVYAFRVPGGTPDSDANSNTNRDTNTDSNGHSHSYVYCNCNSNRNGYSDAHANTVPYSYGYTNKLYCS